MRHKVHYLHWNKACLNLIYVVSARMRLPVRQIASVGSQTVPPIVPVKNRHAQQLRTQHQTQRNEKHTIRPLPGWRNTVTIHHTNNLTFDAVSNFAEAAGRIVVSREGTNGLESHSRGALSGRSVSAMRGSRAFVAGSRQRALQERRLSDRG